MEGLTVGRIVHYRNPDEFQGECRPAMIVKVWDEGRGTSNLTVFTDWSNDRGRQNANPLEWRTSIVAREHTKAGAEWHWPQLCAEDVRAR